MDNSDNNDPPQQPPAAGTGPGQPRKPRIEVLRPGPTAAPEAGIASFGGRPATEEPRGAAQGAPQAHAPGIVSNRPQQSEAAPRRSGGGLLRSPTMLLALLALLVIAGFLLYAYSQRGDDGDYAAREEAVKSENSDLLADPQPYDDAEPAQAEDEAAPGPEIIEEPPAAQPEPREQPSPPEPRDAPAADTREEQAPEPEPAPAGGGASALATVRAFYGALAAGNGASAAQLVVPAKRQSGPLSAGALTRYYSSFRRPLRVRGVTPVDENTVRVAYDYVLADGRLCRGQSSVNLVESGGRRLVSGIRTQGPC